MKSGRRGVESERRENGEWKEGEVESGRRGSEEWKGGASRE